MESPRVVFFDPQNPPQPFYPPEYPQPVSGQTSMRHSLANAPRSVDAPNWRMGMGMGMGGGQGHRHYSSFSSSASGTEYMIIGSQVQDCQASSMGRNTNIDTSGFHGYCLDRGNGNYTRLIPADSLPPLVGIPVIQNSAEGLLVLPQPRGVDPQNLAGSPVQPVAFRVCLTPFFSSPLLVRHQSVGAEPFSHPRLHRHRYLMPFRYAHLFL